MHRALVLSAGGARGSWQVGACEHLIRDRGHWFDVISGVSVGAINGATLAHARDQNDLRSHLKRLRSVWLGVRGNDNIYHRRRHAALGMALGKWGGLYDTTPLREEVVGREIDPAQVAVSPIRLRIGYVDLRSASYRTAANDHPHLRDAVLASCALPVYFPPVRLPDSREVGVDGGLRAFTPLADALHALAEMPPDGESTEIWVMLLQGPRKAPLTTMIQKSFRAAFPTSSFHIRALRRQRTIETFLISAVIRERYRTLRLNVLHPASKLTGSVLDFNPVKIRGWYEDGLRTARGADVPQCAQLPAATQ